MQQKLTITFVLLIAMNSFSQENRLLLSGKVFDSKSVVSNTNILNLTNNKGVISNDLGLFEIYVKINDTLLFSSIQHERKIIVISDDIIESNALNIQLNINVNQLDEVFLTGLTGDLKADIKTVKDTIPKMNFWYNPKTVMNTKNKFEVDHSAAPNALSMTDPTYTGGGGAGATIPNFQLIKEQKLRRELNRKKDFPEKLKRELGERFFTQKLKIPKEKINHFIAYCEYLNILEMYYNHQKLEVIKILTNESKNYSKIIE